jgi:uncharacterized protein
VFSLAFEKRKNNKIVVSTVYGGSVKVIITVFSLISGAVFLLLIWGVFIEPRFMIEERFEDVSIEGIPGWDGKTIAVIADIQIGMWLNNTGTSREAVNRIIHKTPAAVLIAGDFIYNPTEESEEETKEELEEEDYNQISRKLEKIKEILSPLTKAGIPTFAVLGNHDYGLMNKEDIRVEWIAERVMKSLESIGIKVLNNDAVRLSKSGEGEELYLVGIGSHMAGKDNASVALSKVPDGAQCIILMHNPQSFEQIPPNTSPLAIAAHTHGGQVRIPFFPQWSWLTFIKSEKVHADGWIKNFGQEGNKLYVNRGIGFSIFPVRINCLPEITYFNLHSR